MRITAIITHYRNGAFLADAVQSVLSQTRPADEILVIDDATPVADAGALDALPTSVRLIRLPVNGGPGVARQVGAEQATGDWLAYLDADDLWEPTKLERSEAFLSAHPEARSLHTGMIVFATAGGPEKVYLKKPEQHSGSRAVLQGEGLPSGLMLHRAALLGIGGWSADRNLIEDWDLEIRMTNQCGPLWFLPEPLTRFRRANHGNLSSRSMLNVYRQLHTVWHHRRLTTRLHGRGVWRAVASRLLVGESMKIRGVKRVMVWSFAKALRIGAPPIPPH